MRTQLSHRWLGRIALAGIMFWPSAAAAQSRNQAPGHSTPRATLASAARVELHRLGAQNAVRFERRNDSVLNGALIGAAAGVASGVLLCRATEPWDVCNDPGPLLRIGAVGAAIGIGVDALIRPRETVSVTPIASRRAKGLQVAFRF
jgi:hypothetical protein